MQSLVLPELPLHFTRVLMRKFPKKRRYLLGGRAWVRSGNFIKGGSLVRDFFRTFVAKDNVLREFDSRAPSDFCWERGLGTSGFDSDRVFNRLWRNRHKGDAVLKAILLEEYVTFRDYWIKQNEQYYALSKVS